MAVGVLGAQVINFFIMAQLSLGLTSMKWKTFLAAHLPAIRLTAVVLSVVWLVAKLIRSLDMPAITLLVATSVAVALALVLLLYATPKWVLGQDGKWMLEKLLEYIPQQVALFGWTKKMKIRIERRQG